MPGDPYFTVATARGVLMRGRIFDSGIYLLEVRGNISIRQVDSGHVYVFSEYIQHCK